MSGVAPGVESLQFELPGSRAAGAFGPILVGVVGSGNLEVLLEARAGQTCLFEVETSARGFGAIWEAVVRDFQQQHALAGVQVSIHDMGATPAVVALRLAQAVAELPGVQP
ncbi:MAG: malonate decarboxylase acyl carrier protein [Caldimonas sp.]